MRWSELFPSGGSSVVVVVVGGSVVVLAVVVVDSAVVSTASFVESPQAASKHVATSNERMRNVSPLVVSSLKGNFRVARWLLLDPLPTEA